MGRASRIRFLTSAQLRGEGTWFFSFGPGRGLVHTGRWTEAKRRATLLALEIGAEQIQVRVAR